MILLLTPLRLMFAMRWHFGVSSILNTILFGGTPLIDMLWAMFSLLLSFSLGLGVLFGVFAGHASYAGVATSLTETALMAFGFLDYADVTSQGHGSTHDGLGLGSAAIFGPVIFWLAFFLLQIIATNILIAVTGDGYEQHVDVAERQTGSDGKSFVKLAWRVARLRLFYQPSLPIRNRQPQLLYRQEEVADTWDRQTEAWPAWARKMHLACDPRLGALIDALRLPAGMEGQLDLLPAPSVDTLARKDSTLRKDATLAADLDKADEEADEAIGDDTAEDEAEQIRIEARADAMMTHVVDEKATECATIASVLRGIRDDFKVGSRRGGSDEQLGQLAKKIALVFGEDDAPRAKKGNLLRRTVTEVVRKENAELNDKVEKKVAELNDKVDQILELLQQQQQR